MRARRLAASPGAAIRHTADARASSGRSRVYRALDTTIEQDGRRKTQRLSIPILAVGGAASFGERIAEAMRLVADDVDSVVIPETGHFLAEESPGELLAALAPFLDPYRDSAQDGTKHAATAS